MYPTYTSLSYNHTPLTFKHLQSSSKSRGDWQSRFDWQTRGYPTFTTLGKWQSTQNMLWYVKWC